VADSVGAVERLEADDLFEIAKLAFGPADLQAIAIAANGDSGGVVTAVLQAPEAVENYRDDALLAYVTYNSTHTSPLLNRSCGEESNANGTYSSNE
jgi:hypothetical protein